MLFCSHSVTNLLMSLFSIASLNSGWHMANKKRIEPFSKFIEDVIPKDLAYSDGDFKNSSAACLSLSILKYNVPISCIEFLSCSDKALIDIAEEFGKTNLCFVFMSLIEEFSLASSQEDRREEDIKTEPTPKAVILFFIIFL